MLSRLAEQSVDRFELIVVDNNSTDGTSRYVEEHPAIQGLRQRGLRAQVTRELRQGLLHARLNGVSAARGDLVCFLDDDNLPAYDYVERGLDLFENHPLSLACSRVSPAWVQTPPPAIERRKHLLAINENISEHDVFWAPGTVFPPTLGAGLWFRRNDFIRIIEEADMTRLLPDRSGRAMLSGGDIELGHLFSRAGFTCGYGASLRIEHVIPPSRLEVSYFVRLIIGVVRSQMTLERKYGQEKDRLIRTVNAITSMFAAIASVPVLLFRNDPFREVLFVLAARWARLLGPYDF